MLQHGRLQVDLFRDRLKLLLHLDAAAHLRDRDLQAQALVVFVLVLDAPHDLAHVKAEAILVRVRDGHGRPVGVAAPHLERCRAAGRAGQGRGRRGRVRSVDVEAAVLPGRTLRVDVHLGVIAQLQRHLHLAPGTALNLRECGR